MKDRQPGAPGQYKAVIAAAELQKMQTGEAFVITMTRDDQPLVEGTPYNKASVLPDDLAAIICPGVLDPTPADAFRGLLSQRTVVTLSASNWVDNMQSVVVDGVTEDVMKTDVFASAETENPNFEAYNECGVRPHKQLDGLVVFKCENVPTIDLTVNVMVRV